MNQQLATKIISLMDLTSLNLDDNADKIRNLCEQGISSYGAVAAVCIYPEFVEIASSALENTEVRVATVANFPYGNESVQDVLKTIRAAIENGADEIDVVIPYQSYLQGNRIETQDLVRACKEACQGVCLKVILETGALEKPEIIAKASKDVLEAGADFLKTSTGKISIGASLEAAEVMLREINNHYQATGKMAGFKASGGVKTVEQAEAYIELATRIMGADYITADYFRFGASSLLDNVLKSIK
jgi:deoxyribose-phosphate aldolase